MNLNYCLNTAWMWKCRKEMAAFRDSTRQVALTQASLLQEITRRNCSSAYGRQYDFGSIGSASEFQDRLPLMDYDQYEPLVRRIQNGEPEVLTGEPVRLLEPTGGTTRGEKLIPYTDGLKEQFQRAVAVWVGDLLTHRPRIRPGRSYWSISPAFGPPRRSSAGIPIGFDDDTEYLGVLERVIARRLMAVPAGIARSPDIQSFRFRTLLHLLMAEDLALVSVWSPTFLARLFDDLEPWTGRICSALRGGPISFGAGSTATSRDRRFQGSAARRRANELQAILGSADSLPEKLSRIWPRLELISCWADAAAAGFVPEVRRLFPRAEIQPKGLIATEGCISLPLTGMPAAALAIRSHFLEFAETDRPDGATLETSRCQLAHELERGRRYQVLLTTAGGLYRYRLHDVIEVVGFLNQCPLVKFLGKSNLVSDMVGEKLSEPHVRHVLHQAFAKHRAEVSFAMVSPVRGHPPWYRLYLQSRASEDLANALAATVQLGLEENPYYRLAKRLHQLGPLEICWLDPSGESGASMHERYCIERGQKAGDVKPTALDVHGLWSGHDGQMRVCPAALR